MGKLQAQNYALVDSALARPGNLVAYEACDDVARLAAAYAYGIARNHGFADGYNRTALVTGEQEKLTWTLFRQRHCSSW